MPLTNKPVRVTRRVRDAELYLPENMPRLPEKLRKIDPDGAGSYDSELAQWWQDARTGLLREEGELDGAFTVRGEATTVVPVGLREIEVDLSAIGFAEDAIPECVGWALQTELESPGQQLGVMMFYGATATGAMVLLSGQARAGGFKLISTWKGKSQ